MIRKNVLCLLLSFLVISLSGTSSSSQRASAKRHLPKTVVDFFLLLPSRYFEISPDTPRNRLRQAHTKDSVIDIGNGYLFMAGDGAQQSITLCLFKRPDKSYLVVVGDNEAEVCEPYLDFYEYKNGKLPKVTRKVLPEAFRGDRNYLLPRYGKIITVTDRSNHKLYYLSFDRGSFHAYRPRMGSIH